MHNCAQSATNKVVNWKFLVTFGGEKVEIIAFIFSVLMQFLITKYAIVPLSNGFFEKEYLQKEIQGEEQPDQKQFVFGLSLIMSLALAIILIAACTALKQYFGHPAYYIVLLLLSVAYPLIFSVL